VHSSTPKNTTFFDGIKTDLLIEIAKPNLSNKSFVSKDGVWQTLETSAVDMN
jgi:hypothetical protein